MPSPLEHELRETGRARAGRRTSGPRRRGAKAVSRQQHLAKFHGVILGPAHSQCVCRRQICTRSVALSGAHTRNRCGCVRGAHSRRDARAPRRRSPNSRDALRNCTWPASLAEVIWGLWRRPRVPCRVRQSSCGEATCAERARANAAPWHSRCDWSAACRGKRGALINPHAALPQVRTAKRRCISSGEDSHVDATESREVGSQRRGPGPARVRVARGAHRADRDRCGWPRPGRASQAIFNNIAGQLAAAA